jgi:hypothetical protein
MSDLATLTAAFNTWLGRSDLSGATADDINLQVVSKIRQDVRSLTQETTTTITNSAGVNSWPLPADFLFAKSVSLNSNTAPKLSLYPQHLLRTYNEQLAGGEPIFYAFQGETIMVSPPPGTDDQFTITLDYIAAFSALEDLSDTNYVLANAPHLWHHLAQYYANLYTQDMEMANHHIARYQQELQGFNASETKRRMGGSAIRTFGPKGTY